MSSFTIKFTKVDIVSGTVEVPEAVASTKEEAEEYVRWSMRESHSTPPNGKIEFASHVFDAKTLKEPENEGS